PIEPMNQLCSVVSVKHSCRRSNTWAKTGVPRVPRALIRRVAPTTICISNARNTAAEVAFLTRNLDVKLLGVPGSILNGLGWKTAMESQSTQCDDNGDDVHNFLHECTECGG